MSKSKFLFLAVIALSLFLEFLEELLLFCGVTAFLDSLAPEVIDLIFPSLSHLRTLFALVVLRSLM